MADESITRSWRINHHKLSISYPRACWGCVSTGPNRWTGWMSVCYCTSLFDHQASGLYVSLLPVDHQMVVQPTYRTTRWVGCMSVWVPADHQMVVQPTYRTTRWEGCMSVWYHLTTRLWGGAPRGPPDERAVCQSNTIWPPDGGAARLEDPRLVGCMSVWYHLTTRWWGSAPTGPPDERAVCQSSISWPPDGKAVHLQDNQMWWHWAVFQSNISWPTDGGAAHLKDHQVSGLYVSLIPSDHQMVGQPT